MVHSVSKGKIYVFLQKYRCQKLTYKICLITLGVWKFPERNVLDLSLSKLFESLYTGKMFLPNSIL